MLETIREYGLEAWRRAGRPQVRRGTPLLPGGGRGGGTGAERAEQVAWLARGWRRSATTCARRCMGAEAGMTERACGLAGAL